MNYTYLKQNLFLKRCEGCHAQAWPEGGVVLDSYPAVRARLGDIYRTAVVKKTMPLRAPLTDPEVALLAAWIRAGAPDTGDSSDRGSAGGPIPAPTPAPIATPGPVVTEGDFSYIKSVLFTKHFCYECHAAGKQVHYIPVDDLGSLLDPQYKVVVPGKPDESGLITILETTGRNRMPPIQSGDGMTPAEIKIIRDWISRGAKAAE